MIVTRRWTSSVGCVSRRSGADNRRSATSACHLLRHSDGAKRKVRSRKFSGIGCPRRTPVDSVALRMECPNRGSCYAACQSVRGRGWAIAAIRLGPHGLEGPSERLGIILFPGHLSLEQANTSRRQVQVVTIVRIPLNNLVFILNHRPPP